jgi:FMN reductase
MNESRNRPITIVVIRGSVRPGNYTGYAANLVVDELRKHPDVRCVDIDPSALDLPLPGLSEVSLDADNLRKTVSEATGVILTTPEYHGCFSSVAKLTIENLGFPSQLAGKPVALLGVAAGQIGAIKSLEMLRSVCSHVGAIVLPGPISVARVREVFDAQGNCLDPGVEQRVRGVATTLLDYIHKSICPLAALETMVRQA